MQSIQLEQAAADIKQRIAELEALSEEDLKGAMTDLKKALMENPAACGILLPAEVGEMVKALRRITGEALAEAAKPKSRAPKKQKQLSLEDISAAFDEL